MSYFQYRLLFFPMLVIPVFLNIIYGTHNTNNYAFSNRCMGQKEHNNKKVTRFGISGLAFMELRKQYCIHSKLCNLDDLKGRIKATIKAVQLETIFKFYWSFGRAYFIAKKNCIDNLFTVYSNNKYKLSRLHTYFDQKLAYVRLQTY